MLSAHSETVLTYEWSMFCIQVVDIMLTVSLFLPDNIQAHL